MNLKHIFYFFFIVSLPVFSQVENTQEENESNYKRALEYYEKGELQNALFFLDKVYPKEKKEEELKELILFRKNHSLFTDNYPKNYELEQVYELNPPNYEEFLILKVKNLQSIGQYEEASILLKSMLHYSSFSKYTIFKEQATTFELQGKIDSAKTYYRKAFTFSKNIEDSVQVYLGLGSSFLYLNQPDSSYYYFDNALQFIQKQLFQSPYLEQEIYNQLGRLSAITRKFKEALEYYYKAVQASKNLQVDKNPLLARHYYGLSQVYKYYEVYNIDSSLYYAQKALVSQMPSFDEIDNLYQNPDSISKSDGLNSILYLTSKIWILWLRYRTYFEEKDLQAALQTALHSLQVIKKYEVYLELENQNDKLLISKQTMRICKQGQILSQVLLNDSLGLFFSEEIKANVLKQEILSQKKHTLKQINVYSLANIQNSLSENESIVLYSFPQISSTYELEKLNIIYIDQQSFQIKRVELPPNFNDNLQQYLQAIEGNNRKEFLESAYYLYQTLIQPIESFLDDKEKLIIIPEGRLLQIPFEAFLTKETLSIDSYKTLPYFFLDFEISYHYSASLWVHSKKKQNTIKQNELLAFAPVFNNELGYVLPPLGFDRGFSMIDSLTNKYLPLPASEEEVVKIHQTFESQNLTSSLTFINDMASEQNFKEYSNEYRFLHLATHSLTDLRIPELSHIVFSPDSVINQKEDGRLYLEEIYDLDLNTELVTLSSCESGLGKLIKGEGALSLARAFLYAGSQNVLFSLWKVSDEASKDFMITFYQHFLEDNMTYSQALQQTRLDILQEYPHPSNWTSFIWMGE